LFFAEFEAKLEKAFANYSERAADGFLLVANKKTDETLMASRF